MQGSRPVTAKLLFFAATKIVVHAFWKWLIRFGSKLLLHFSKVFYDRCRGDATFENSKFTTHSTLSFHIQVVSSVRTCTDGIYYVYLKCHLPRIAYFLFASHKCSNGIESWTFSRVWSNNITSGWSRWIGVRSVRRKSSAARLDATEIIPRKSCSRRPEAVVGNRRINTDVSQHADNLCEGRQRYVVHDPHAQELVFENTTWTDTIVISYCHIIVTYKGLM